MTRAAQTVRFSVDGAERRAYTERTSEGRFSFRSLRHVLRAEIVMTRRQTSGGRFAILLATAIAVVASLGTPSASGHIHPAPPDLTAPGVVYIESGYDVHITVVEHSPTMTLTVRRGDYSAPMTKGSGFVVNPAGYVVTTSAVVTSDQQMAKDLAINLIFKKYYGASDPTLVPADPMTQRSFGPQVGQPGDYSNLARLKACYEGQPNSAGLCDVTATPFVTVHPYVTDQAKYGNLAATVLKTTSSGIAVLRVPAGLMPTVTLTDVQPATYHLWVFGFHDIPVTKSPLDAFKAHMDKPGGTVFGAPTGVNKVFAEVTPAVLADGLQGGPVAVELGNVIGMISATPAPAGQPGAGGPTLIGSKDIRAALASVNVSPASGLADGPYVNAMHLFQNKGYAASIPGFRAALVAYPGDYMAALHLKQAEASAAAAGNAIPSSASASASVQAAAAPTSSQSTAWWVWLVVGAAVLLLMAVVWLLLRRPGPRQGADASPPPRPTPAPGSAVAQPRTSASSGPLRGGGVAVEAKSRPPAVVAQSGSRPHRAAPPREQRAPITGNDGVAVSQHAPAPSRPSVAVGQRFCTSCGGRLAAHHAFCGWCGEPVQ
jgi:hypothetical protein